MIALLAFLWWVVVPLSAVSWGVAVAGMLSVEPRLRVIIPGAAAPMLLMGICVRKPGISTPG